MYSATYFVSICLAIFFNGLEGMATFDEAYFYEPNALESTCDNQLVQLTCLRACGSRFTCSHGKCYCERPNDDDSDELGRIFREIQKYVYFHYFNDKNRNKEIQEIVHHTVQTPKPFVDSTLRVTGSKPALRHHIAHFCPNLEVARKCIRSCMKVGKPAFCGKDHACYCGHKYPHTQPDKPLNVDDMYAEFRDLYEKYFGPNEEEND